MLSACLSPSVSVSVSLCLYVCVSVSLSLSLSLLTPYGLLWWALKSISQNHAPISATTWRFYAWRTVCTLHCAPSRGRSDQWTDSTRLWHGVSNLYTTQNTLGMRKIILMIYHTGHVRDVKKVWYMDFVPVIQNNFFKCYFTVVVSWWLYEKYFLHWDDIPIVRYIEVHHLEDTQRTAVSLKRYTTFIHTIENIDFVGCLTTGFILAIKVLSYAWTITKGSSNSNERKGIYTGN